MASPYNHTRQMDPEAEEVSEPGGRKEAAWLKRNSHWAAKALGGGGGGGAGNTSQYMQTDLGFSSSFTVFEFVYKDRFCFPTFSLSLSIQNSMNKCRIFARRGK